MTQKCVFWPGVTCLVLLSLPVLPCWNFVVFIFELFSPLNLLRVSLV